jgi:predicted MFS family arabinose efflux permease
MVNRSVYPRREISAVPLLRPDRRYRPGPFRLAAVGLSLIAVCYGLARFAYGLFVPALRSEFVLDATTAGLIGAGSYLGYSVAITASAVLTARWGPRRVAMAAGVLATAGTAVVAGSPNSTVLAFGVLLAGTSTGVASPPLAAAVARHVEHGLHDRVQAVVNAGTGLGVLVSGPVALLVDAAWRWAWAGFAMLAAAATVWVAATLPPDQHQRESTPDGTRSWPAPLVPSGAPRMVVAAAVMGAASSAVWTFGPDLVLRETTGGPQASVLLWTALGGAGLVGAFTGDLAQKIGLARAWTISSLAMAAATVGVANAASWYPAAVVAGGVFGAVYIALTAVLLIWGTRVYPHAPAFGVGTAFLMIALGQACGAPLVGWLSDLFGAVPAFLVAAATAVAACMSYPRLTGSADVAGHRVGA